MKTNKFLNTAFLIPISIFLLGLIVIYFWRKDVEYRRCWDLLNISQDQTILEKTNCKQVFKNNLIK